MISIVASYFKGATSYFKGDPGSTWEEPKEGQADQGTSKQPGGVPLALLPFPDLPGLPPGSSLGLPDNASKHHAPAPEKPFGASSRSFQALL